MLKIVISLELLRTIIYDKVTGLTSAQAISAALYQKEKGEGRSISPNIYDGICTLLQLARFNDELYF